MSFLLSLFLLSQFPLCWASCHFHCTGFSLCSSSTVGAFTELGFCCAWPQPCQGQARVVSARLNPRNSTIYVREVCNFLGSVSLKQKFEVMGGPVLQLSFIWQSKENTSSRVERRPTQKRWRDERESSILAPLFMCFFLLLLSLLWVNWASQEGCSLHLRFSLRSSDLPLFYFHGLFPSLSFSHCHSGLLFPILTT